MRRQGTVDSISTCEPVFDYGAIAPRVDLHGQGLRRGARPTGRRLRRDLLLTTDLRLGFEGRARRRAARRSARRDRLRRALLGTARPPGNFDEAFERMDATSDYWRDWLAHGRFPDHPWRSYLERSALTLKGLTFAPTGRDRRRADQLAAARAAAASATGTTATPGSATPASCSGALYTLGFDREADDFFYFSPSLRRERRDADHVRHRRRARPRGATLDHLSGYGGARPVRIGNGAYDQRRTTSGAMLLDSAYLHTRSRDQLPERVWDVLRTQVEAALERWREPDRGIWEVRGEPRHFTSSKVMCWVAADRGARLAALRGEDECADALAQPPPTRSTRTSAPTPSTIAACSRSTTTPTGSTRRCC